LKPICVIGSLGDVLKIHGREAEKKINKMLTEMGTPYYYFKGEVPDTWYGMIDIWYRHTDIFMDK